MKKKIPWILHWIARLLICFMVLPYAVMKLNLMQMGVVDYSQLLITQGEKSPMGFLWTFMALSPVIQFTAGAVELLAGILVLWRRTAWLGGLIGTVSLGVVWLLNMTYDVPVKQLSFAQMVLFFLVLAPWLPRLGRFIAGRPVGPLEEPRLIESPKVHRFTRWFPAAATVVILAGSAYAAAVGLPHLLRPESTQLAGVYEVTQDSDQPADSLADDTRWHYLALGNMDAGPDQEHMFSLRRVNGDLQYGFYTVDGDHITLELSEPMTNDETNAGPGWDEEPVETVELHWETTDDGMRFTGDDSTRELERYELGEQLVSRPFSWTGTPYNR
ncbi:hypothetical protein [Corynebacterium massiliense]|uniref:DoxX family protein n=1 Tax=Corynebacterium massiliense DSM 45435 TaxID=1121364 RepID=A0ABY7U5D1_9CORY|nr:hypothetical protein [Corynebacterium massiliense]WCZ31586.1 hypothetical protein CMASS_00580 [Corynebacterium massiliense DSM 45435]